MKKAEGVSASLAVVVGQNCRRIRSESDVTQNVLAKHARSVGLRWTTSKVGQFERGQNAPTFGTLVALSIALSRATRSDVVPADLVAFDGFVEFNDDLRLVGSKVEAALRGEPWGTLTVEDAGIDPAAARDVVTTALAKFVEKGQRRPKRYGALDVSAIMAAAQRSGIDEERVAKRLGVELDRLHEASVFLWGQSFSDQRDKLAGPGANAQKRGRVSRNLQMQLEEELARGDD